MGTLPPTIGQHAYTSPCNNCEDTQATVRELELSAERDRSRLNTLFDTDGNPGLLSRLQTTIVDKFEQFAKPVNEWIVKEQERRQHYDRGWQQAVVDIKDVQEKDRKELAETTNKMHEDNRSRLEAFQAENKAQFTVLNQRANKHESLVQRGIGIVIAIQVFMAVGAFLVTMGTFFILFVVGGLWWFFTHVAVAK